MISTITTEVIKLAKEVIDSLLHWQATEYRFRRRGRHYTNLWKF